MKILDVIQGSDEWLDARLGIPTASCADKIITPKQRKPSGQQTTYRNQLLAEWLIGMPIDWTGSSEFMERGTVMEEDARRWYAMHTGRDVEQVGFILRDDGLFGGSPDGLVGDNGGIEIKCPSLHVHVGYMLGEGPDHTGQVQALLYLTGREWWDVVAYHPDLPSVVTRVEPDPEYIDPFVQELDRFLLELVEARERLAEYRETMGVAA